jgi:hypothetical protein
MDDQEEKKSSAINFRCPGSFRKLVDELADNSGWKVTDIACTGLMVFWPDIEAMVVATRPNPNPDDVEEMREMAKLFRSARAHKVDVRRTLIEAVEAKLAEQATIGTGT